MDGGCGRETYPDVIALAELLGELQIGLEQVVLHQDFQGLGKASRSIAVYLADVFERVRQI
nr:hypothetical protein [uncultured Acetatifactor sp.]